MASVAEAFALALQHHQAGNLPQAQQIYELILQADPRMADAHHLLGVCACQMGRHEQAVASIQHALSLSPQVAAFHSNLGLAQQALGGLEDAVASYRTALQLQPDFGEARSNLAGALLAQDKLEEAEEHGRQALLLQPHSPQAHNNLGYCLLRQEKMDEAVVHFEEALRLQPDFADAHTNLGLALAEQGRLEDAVAECNRALKLNPRLSAAHNNLGHALRKMGKLDESMAAFRQALQIKADFAEALHNLGSLLRSLPIKGNRGSMLAHISHLEEAEACCRQALKIRPNFADTLATLGAVLWELGKKTEALTAFEQALEAKPNDLLRVVWATLLPVVYESMADVHAWRQRLVQEIRRLHDGEVKLDLTLEPAVLLFFLVYQGMNDKDLQRQVAGLYRAPLPNGESTAFVAGSGSVKIRIGFLSSFFQKHTIGLWMQGLIAQLSRDDFEVIVLSIGSHHDDVAAFIRRHADRYLEIPTHLPAARRLVAEQKLDVLLYPDIGMDNITNTLAFSRLAPIQCVTLGHPVTTGIDTIDYFISTEALETPEADEHYTETLVRLESLPIYYYKPQLPGPLLERSRFGLKGEDHVYACLQSPFKLHPSFDDLLGGILRGDPRGTLVLSQGLAPHWEQILRQRLARALADVVDRIRFFPMLSYNDYLNLVALSDVQLDPTPFGSGATSFDAFAVGTPIVTMPSRFLRGRITFALYKQMKILDCVATEPRQYIDIALRLGTDSAYRETMRRKIVDAHALLFENSSGVRDLEQFFRRAVQSAKKEPR